MPLRYPFQKLCVLPHIKTDRQLIVAASGPTLNCISFPDGKLLYQWPSQQDFDDDISDGEKNDEPNDRPAKKLKLESNGPTSLSRQQSETSDASIEIVSERKKGERKKTKFIDTKLPNVSHLLATSDGEHVIAVTAEDKALRVFKLGSSGKLMKLSERSLPKKLCAVRLTKDEKTILAADKFGDVYAVPLHQSKDWVRKAKHKDDQTFRPSASELTVHTKGNLEALRQQKEQKRTGVTKEEPNFEHQLLLGHVSLLTDLAVAEGMVNGKPRPFILTSDRDEHIRVSRGMPQSHIIENFCLDNREFVTKLCIPSLRPELLLAGNGEPSLRLYDWQNGRLIDTAIMGMRVEAEFTLDPRGHEPELPEGRSHENFAVSGIWQVDFSKTIDPHGEEQCLILVAIEGSPFLHNYVLSNNRLIQIDPIELQGNVLDVVILNSTRQILVSIDSVHKAWSTKSYRDEQPTGETLLQLFEVSIQETWVTHSAKFKWTPKNLPFDDSDLAQSLPEAPAPTDEVDNKSKGCEKIFSSLGELLYGLENLRKKRDLSVPDLMHAEVDKNFHGIHGVPLEEPEEEI